MRQGHLLDPLLPYRSKICQTFSTIAYLPPKVSRSGFTRQRENVTCIRLNMTAALQSAHRKSNHPTHLRDEVQTAKGYYDPLSNGDVLCAAGKSENTTNRYGTCYCRKTHCARKTCFDTLSDLLFAPQ